MPAGKVHLRIELVLAGMLAIGGGVLVTTGVFSSTTVAVFFAAYLFSSLFLSPDLDLWESRATKRWGIGRVLWYPYSKLFRHRRISHHLILGPLTRIVYLGAFVVLGAWGWCVTVHRRMDMPALPRDVIIAIVLGLYVPNQIHIVTDRVWSWLRRWNRRR